MALKKNQKSSAVFGNMLWRHRRKMSSYFGKMYSCSKKCYLCTWVTYILAETGYVAGTNHLTVVDLAFVATYSTIKAVGHRPGDLGLI